MYFSRLPGSLACLLLSGLALALATGCTTATASTKAFVPSNHSGDAVMPATVRRVVLLPLAGAGVAPPASLADLDPVVAAALQQQNRFEVIALSRDTCRRLFGSEELASVSALPPEFLAAVQHEYAADAVLFVDVTVFRAYRPLEIGFRAKLATVRDVRLVWVFDNLFSAADPAVVNSARRHVLTGGLPDIPADLSPAVVQSPSRFAAYAAEAMFATLPPVPPAGAPVVVADETPANAR
jgi:hypothetical protein